MRSHFKKKKSKKQSEGINGFSYEISHHIIQYIYISNVHFEESCIRTELPSNRCATCFKDTQLQRISLITLKPSFYISNVSLSRDVATLNTVGGTPATIDLMVNILETRQTGPSLSHPNRLRPSRILSVQICAHLDVRSLRSPVALPGKGVAN